MRSFPKAKEAFSEGEKVSFGVHRLHVGDAREVLASFPEASVHLVVTSPPYWTLKRYEDTPGQLGHIEDYEAFLDELDRVWREVFRLLVPGGRLVIVVGDVAVARRRFGRHLVFPSTPTSRCAAASSGLITSTPSSGTSTPTPARRWRGGASSWASPTSPGPSSRRRLSTSSCKGSPGVPQAHPRAAGEEPPSQGGLSPLLPADLGRHPRGEHQGPPRPLPPGARRAPGADVQLRGGRGLRPLRRDRDHPHRRGEVGEEGFGRGARAAVRSAGQRALCQGSSWVFPGGLGWSHPSSPLG